MCNPRSYVSVDPSLSVCLDQPRVGVDVVEVGDARSGELEDSQGV